MEGWIATMKLENRKAIVTGAAQGLGFAIAKRLNDEGCRVAMLDINEEKVCEAEIGRAHV